MDKKLLGKDVYKRQGLLLRIVGMAGVGYGEDVTLPKVRQKAVEVFTEPEQMCIRDRIMVLRQNGVSQFLVACDCGVGLYAAEIVNGLRATTDHD